MGAFYILEDGMLIGSGHAPDGMESKQARAGQECCLGPAPVPTSPRPHPAYRWHVAQEEWVDLRTPQEKAEHDHLEWVASRRSAYPPIEDFADAHYWLTQGDSSKMDAYLTKIAEVKAQFPKSN